MSRNLNVGGMSCEGCESSVVDSLRGVVGVEDAEADHESDSVTVEGDADDEAVERAIEDAGYTVER